MNTSQEQQADEFLTDIPEGWRPEEGSKIVGKVIGVQKGWSDQGESYYPIIIIDDELSGQKVSVHGFHFVLKDRLASLRPQLGERIGIKMGAKVPSKDGRRSIQLYTVRIDGRAEDIWDDIRSPRVQKQGTQTSVPVSAVDSDEDIPF